MKNMDTDSGAKGFLSKRKKANVAQKQVAYAPFRRSAYHFLGNVYSNNLESAVLQGLRKPAGSDACIQNGPITVQFAG
jgi:hypothetical protein